MSKICIAGGGSSYTPGIILTLLENREALDVNEIRLYDIDEERNNDMYLIIREILKNEQIDMPLIQTQDPETAFSGIDFVFSQIRAGGIEMREQDEKIPLSYDLVGQETCGLGGFSYGLRSLKGFLKMVSYIEQYAPDAWVLNYTNPESIISEGVRRSFPNLKIVNACDMTIGIEEVLSDIFGYDRTNWICQYYGLNHFGWFKSIYDTELKRDVMPEILEKLTSAQFDISELEEKYEYIDQSWIDTYKMFAEMTKDFPNQIPNTYLQYYLYPMKVVKKENPNYTRANEIMNGRLKHIKEVAKNIRETNQMSKDEFQSGGHGQYIVDIAKSIKNNLNQRFNLIVPNMGAIPNVRRDAVVEVPSYVNATGVEPISLRFDIPDFHKGLIEAQVASEKLLVDAYFDNSYQKALEAFALNQTVPSTEIAKKVLDEFITVNGDLWPELK